MAGDNKPSFGFTAHWSYSDNTDITDLGGYSFSGQQRLIISLSARWIFPDEATYPIPCKEYYGCQPTKLILIILSHDTI